MRRTNKWKETYEESQGSLPGDVDDLVVRSCVDEDNLGGAARGGDEENGGFSSGDA